MPAKPPVTDDTLKRERAGTYRTRDGRFTVEQSSSGWLVYDAEQTDELGLPLARGPYPTLDGAKAALGDARNGPAPLSLVPGQAAKGTNRGAARAPARTPKPSRPTLVASRGAPRH
ncbi:MAG: hypothetical protein ABI620_03770, partial [Chloroflexota bacterium]